MGCLESSSLANQRACDKMFHVDVIKDKTIGALNKDVFVSQKHDISSTRESGVNR